MFFGWRIAENDFRMGGKVEKKHLWEAKIKSILMILLGNTIYALGIVLFILPNQLITGGTTGIALVVNLAVGLPVETFVGIFNIAMLLLGAVVLGREFALTTILSSLYYPVILGVLQHVVGDFVITQDLMLSTVCAGVLIGVGLGIVIRQGASTGGMDIPPLILNRKFRIPVSVSMYAFDTLILIMQMIRSDSERVLYGILLILIYTIVLDKILITGKSQMQLKIVSKKYEEINTAILKKFDRGTTLMSVRGGYLKQDSFAILVVLDSRQLSPMIKEIQEIDPDAFIIVNQISEVRGKGFTLAKEYKKRKRPL